MRNRLRSLIVLCGMMAGGCSSGTPATTDSGAVSATDSGTVTPDSGMMMMGDDAGSLPGVDAGMGSSTVPAGAAERLVGSWGSMSTFASIQTLPFLGDQRSITRAFGIVTIAETAEGLTFTERGCHVESGAEGGGGSAMSEIPDAIPRSVEPRSVLLQFTGSGADARWLRPLLTNAIGYRGTGASDEMLPMNAMDSRVFDQDGDGQPGVTVHISGLAMGDVHVVQRAQAWYSGPLAGSGDLIAENHAEGGAQRTIGATNPLLMMDVPVRPDTDTSDNVIRLVRLEGASTDCDALMAQRAALFGE